jgi:hypothetical protein
MSLICFVVKGVEVSLDPENLSAIGDNLNEELLDLPKQFAKVSQYLAYMNAERDRLKVAWEYAKARRYSQLKTGGYEQLYNRKPTEEALSYALDEDTEILNLRKSWINAGQTAEELYGLRTSLQIKLDTVKEISFHVRLEKRAAMEASI